MQHLKFRPEGGKPEIPVFPPLVDGTEENMKKYVENRKEYPLLYRLWDLEKFLRLPLYISFGTWKNS